MLRLTETVLPVITVITVITASNPSFVFFAHFGVNLWHTLYLIREMVAVIQKLQEEVIRAREEAERLKAARAEGKEEGVMEDKDDDDKEDEDGNDEEQEDEQPAEDDEDDGV